MDLLSPDAVEEGRKEAEEGRSARLEALAHEEQAVIRKLNAVKDMAEAEEAKLAESLSALRTAVETEKATMVAEVVALERRRADALASLKDREDAVGRKEDELAARDRKLAEDEVNLLELRAQASNLCDAYAKKIETVEAERAELKSLIKTARREIAETAGFFDERERILEAEKARLRAYFENKDK